MPQCVKCRITLNKFTSYTNKHCKCTVICVQCADTHIYETMKEAFEKRNTETEMVKPACLDCESNLFLEGYPKMLQTLLESYTQIIFKDKKKKKKEEEEEHLPVYPTRSGRIPGRNACIDCISEHEQCVFSSLTNRCERCIQKNARCRRLLFDDT
jgi:hypothetical protein